MAERTPRGSWAVIDAPCVVIAVLWLLVVMTQLGCAGPRRQPAVPDTVTARAEIPGAPGARYYLTDDLDRWIDDTKASNERAVLARADSGMPPDAPVDFLAISGGGDNGAFGAGLLVGWTESGTRPEFGVITGISTGALIAPFAFLGAEYDHVLRDVYTNVSPDDILDKRFLPRAALFDDGLADSAPLREIIERYITVEFLEKVAAQWERGRWLMIVTTDLDSRRPVVWNMGQIARAANDEALKLFRSVMLASASIPGAFPPVMIEVEVDGERFEEMHVDGGAVAQAFLFPPSYVTTYKEKNLLAERERNVYVIRNARLDPHWASVERRTLSILGRATSTLLHSQGYGDLLRIYIVCDLAGADFNLAFIPADFDAPHTEQFDTAYMRTLFDLAFRMAKEGYPWLGEPPGIQSFQAIRSAPK